MASFIIPNSSFIILLLACAVFAQAQEPTASCPDLLRDALQRHHAVPDSGSAVRRIMHVATVRAVAGRQDTTTSDVETIEWEGGRMIRSDGMEVWSDDRTMIVLEEKTKRLRVIDLTDKRRIVASQERFNTAFPDSLVEYGKAFRCEEMMVAGAGRTHVSFGVDTTMQRFFNAASMTAEIDEHGEIVRMGIVHPPASPIRQTEFVVEQIDREWREPGLSGPVLNRFFDEAGALRKEYADYRP